MPKYTEKSYIIALWYLELPEDKSMPMGGNWLCNLWRNAPGEKLSFEYRFRIYVDNSAFGSEDMKSYTSGSLGDDITDAECETIFDEVAATLGRAAGSETQKIAIHGNFTTFIETTKDVPWMHKMDISKDQQS